MKKVNLKIKSVRPILDDWRVYLYNTSVVETVEEKNIIEEKGSVTTLFLREGVLTAFSKNGVPVIKTGKVTEKTNKVLSQIAMLF